MKVENLKAGKRKLKPSMTRQLNELAGRIAGGEIKSREEIEEIKAISERLEGLKKKNMDILEESRALYQQEKNLEMQVYLDF